MNDLRNLPASEVIAAKAAGLASAASSRMLVNILMEAAGGRRLRLLELGCRNGQFARHLFERGPDCEYTGVDFSESLLETCRTTFAHHDHVRFVQGNLETLDTISGRFDFAIYSYAFEMLASPERSLRAAKRFADRILIRFSEPPDFDTTSVELRQIDLGAGPTPYLLWKIGKSFYRLMLAELDAKRVEIYRTSAREQVHLLYL